MTGPPVNVPPVTALELRVSVNSTPAVGVKPLPLLAAVGPLQFEVVQFRLESEYGAESRLEAAPWTVVRWLPREFKDAELDALALPTGAAIAFDMGENPVVLFANDWSANYFQQTNPKAPLSALPVPLRQD